MIFMIPELENLSKQIDELKIRIEDANKQQFTRNLLIGVFFGSFFGTLITKWLFSI